MAQKFTSLFSKELRTTAVRAAEIAIRYNHEQIDLAHFLLAFIEDSSKGIGDLSTEMDPDLEATRSRVQVFLDSVPKNESNEIRMLDLRYTRRLEVIVEHARKEAIRRGTDRISSVPLFLALASEDFYSEAERGVVSERLLSPVGMTPKQIEQRLRDLPGFSETRSSHRPPS
jgi:ATP-dependent Clp protease ATP-binding subunit ClpA